MALIDKLKNMLGANEPEAAPAVKPGRNDACWCGSGKKYKKCHLPEEEQKAAAKACSLNCGPS